MRLILLPSTISTSQDISVTTTIRNSGSGPGNEAVQVRISVCLFYLFTGNPLDLSYRCVELHCCIQQCVGFEKVLASAAIQNSYEPLLGVALQLYL